LALGGLAGIQRIQFKSNDSWLDRVTAIIREKSPDTKIHLFGMRNHKMVEAYAPNSIDVSSPFSYARFGRICIPCFDTNGKPLWEKGLRELVVSKKLKQQSQVSLPQGQMEFIDRYINQEGFISFRSMEDSTDLREMFNLKQILKQATYLEANAPKGRSNTFMNILDLI
jgi:hypothetical protein